MDIFARIAEERIKEAIERGEFDRLPGAGKPLKIEDLSHVPEELRSSYLMMKNAGYLPEEAHLLKEMVSLRDLLNAARDDGERSELGRRLSEKQLRYRMLMEQRGIRAIPGIERYEEKIRSKLEGD